MKAKTALWLIRHKRLIVPAAILVLALAVWFLWFR